jgi:hypothetical protein
MNDIYLNCFNAKDREEESGIRMTIGLTNEMEKDCEEKEGKRQKYET